MEPKFKKKIGIVSVSAVSKRKTIPTQTLKKWQDQYGSDFSNTKPDTGSDTEVRELRILIAEFKSAFGDITLPIHLLTKYPRISFSTSEKKEFILRYLGEHFGIRESCKMMHMSTSNLYYKGIDWKRKDAPVLKKIEDFLKRFPASGLPSVTSHLKKTMVINRKRIARIMKKNGLINTRKGLKKV